jgi:hypothetical protein
MGTIGEKGTIKPHDCLQCVYVFVCQTLVILVIHSESAGTAGEPGPPGFDARPGLPGIPGLKGEPADFVLDREALRGDAGYEGRS